MSPPAPFGARRRLFWAALLALLPLVVAPAQTPVRPAPAPEIVQKTLAPGVVWTQETTPANAPGGPLLVNMVRIAPDALKHDRFRAALGYGHVWENNATQGREAISETARRENALVAINGGFFTFVSGHPLGLHVQNGEAVTEPLLGRTAFCISKDGKASVAAFTGSGTVTTTDGATIAITGMNRKPGKGNELLLFTPHFWDKTLPVPDRVEMPVTGIKAVRFNETLHGTAGQIATGGGTLLPAQTVVLSGSGTAAAFLRDHVLPGTKVSVRYEIAPPIKNLRQAIAGGPRLLTNGVVTISNIAEGFDAAFSETRHPRTAAGIAADGSIILLTVDGRQPLLSRGASLAETAALLKRFGAVDAVNLDGGGSTTLALRGLVVNSPSGGAERPVANAFVLEGMPPTKPEGVLLTPGRGTVTVGSGLPFALPLGVSQKDGRTAVWGVRGNVGRMRQTGLFYAERPGNGAVVAALADGRRFTFPVRVVPDPNATPLPTSSPTPTPLPSAKP